MDKVKLFRIATVITGKGVSYFAQKHKCSVQNIYQILKGQYRSQKIEQDIDTFISESLQSIGITVNSLKKAA